MIMKIELKLVLVQKVVISGADGDDFLTNQAVDPGSITPSVGGIRPVDY